MSADAASAELIRAHARHPVGRDADDLTDPARGRCEVVTPTCGDRLELRVRGDAGRIAIAWSGRGCEVSQGSASLLVDELDGADAASARRRATLFLEAMARRDGAGELGDEAALLAVAANPVRSVCATLAWRALLGALDDGGLE